MSAVTRKDLQIVRGDTEDLVFTISVDDASEDFAGWTLTVTCREDAAADETIFSKEVSIDTSGKAEVRLEPAETRPVAFSMPYDVQISTDDSQVRTVLMGELKPTQQITR